MSLSEFKESLDVYWYNFRIVESTPLSNLTRKSINNVYKISKYISSQDFYQMCQAKSISIMLVTIFILIVHHTEFSEAKFLMIGSFSFVSLIETRTSFSKLNVLATISGPSMIIIIKQRELFDLMLVACILFLIQMVSSLLLCHRVQSINNLADTVAILPSAFLLSKSPPIWLVILAVTAALILIKAIYKQDGWRCLIFYNYVTDPFDLICGRQDRIMQRVVPLPKTIKLSHDGYTISNEFDANKTIIVPSSHIHIHKFNRLKDRQHAMILTQLYMKKNNLVLDNDHSIMVLQDGCVFVGYLEECYNIAIMKKQPILLTMNNTGDHIININVIGELEDSFKVTVIVNGVPKRFIIDTGAELSMCDIPGIKCGDRKVRTAFDDYKTLELHMGKFQIDKTDPFVATYLLGRKCLIGQNILSRMSLTMENGTVRLTRRSNDQVISIQEIEKMIEYNKVTCAQLSKYTILILVYIVMLIIAMGWKSNLKA
jgi:hypothetical protein